MAMTIDNRFSETEGIWKVKLRGEVDIYTSNEFKEALQKISSGEKLYDIHMDFSDLDYIDSTGLGILIGILKRVKQQEKEIHIRSPKQNVKKIFVITGLDKIFKMEE
ncbi:MAG: STAS domain-containing protein [Peptostreptococcaceae bacterium]|nr:STAS domain-containing protein [Peptostreptococcaceae bacterium]